VRGFVAALDSASRPAMLEWRGTNHARIRAILEPGEIISTQINYHPGWHAAAMQNIPTIREDGIGLMVVDPHCAGNCEISLEYDGGWESRVCRAAGTAMLLLLFVAVLLQFARGRKSTPSPRSR
jgi:hypothetical protein